MSSVRFNSRKSIVSFGGTKFKLKKHLSVPYLDLVGGSFEKDVDDPSYSQTIILADPDGERVILHISGTGFFLDYGGYDILISEREHIDSDYSYILYSSTPLKTRLPNLVEAARLFNKNELRYAHYWKEEQ